MEKQVNLNGEKVDIQPVDTPVYLDDLRFNDVFRRGHSAWITLRLFDQCKESYVTLNQLDKFHYVFGIKGRAINTLINHLKLLRNGGYIALIAKETGQNKRTNIYKITEKGKYLYEKYLFER